MGKEERSRIEDRKEHQQAETTGVVIGTFIRYPRGPTRMKDTDMYVYIYI
jgi:hypothetical protein